MAPIQDVDRRYVPMHQLRAGMESGTAGNVGGKPAALLAAAAPPDRLQPDGERVPQVRERLLHQDRYNGAGAW